MEGPNVYVCKKSRNVPKKNVSLVYYLLLKKQQTSCFQEVEGHDALEDAVPTSPKTSAGKDFGKPTLVC